MSSSETTAGTPERLRVRVEGVVQGVGFRPFVYRLARDLGLSGYVRNDARGVLAEVEAGPDALERFLERIAAEAPPLASVESVRREAIPTLGDAGFRILESEVAGRAEALVSPDTASCPDCLSELADPSDRRYRYPFVNCTNCGPRFTIVRGIPYDRPLTTMAGFELCAACRAEYEDPGDRRFHAQPNACPACGPRVRLLDARESPVATGGSPAATGEADGPTGEVREAAGEAVDPIRRAARALSSGSIVAVKGLGGYHLACAADDEEAVARLRSRKHREDKPFALMVRDVRAAEGLVRLGAVERRLLESRERPIVLCPRRKEARVARSVAPGHRDLGLMLPYTPLHHLLLGDGPGALVMTSGNVSDEPIAYRDDEARERLAGIADLFLVHDRPIETRTDDSVVRAVRVGGERRPLLLRRSRGYVPASLPLPDEVEAPLLACGAHLKNTFTVARGDRAWAGHHIGDLENWETLRSFGEGVAHFERLFEVDPELLVHDLHPDYLSTRYAVERRDREGGRAAEGATGSDRDPIRLLGVQHHHAHLAACLAEHGERGPALGAIFDGTGFGPDGTIWGGELLLGDLEGFERVGHLWPVRMPGGEAAVREPWRMALSWLLESEGVGAEAPEPGEEDPEPGVEAPIPERPPTLSGAVDGARWAAVGRLLRAGLRSPPTTSAGRLFDAVSALCGIRARIRYEGQAAIELEMAAARHGRPEGGYPFPLLPAEDGPSILDARAAVRAVRRDIEHGVSAAVVAARFHEGLANATAHACVVEASAGGVETVALSGGVFQNVLFLERTAQLLHEAGLRVLAPSAIPPNDGGISFGQAVVAAARGARRRSGREDREATAGG